MGILPCVFGKWTQQLTLCYEIITLRRMVCPKQPPAVPSAKTCASCTNPSPTCVSVPPPPCSLSYSPFSVAHGRSKHTLSPSTSTPIIAELDWHTVTFLSILLKGAQYRAQKVIVKSPSGYFSAKRVVWRSPRAELRPGLQNACVGVTGALTPPIPATSVFTSCEFRHVSSKMEARTTVLQGCGAGKREFMPTTQSSPSHAGVQDTKHCCLTWRWPDGQWE